MVKVFLWFLFDGWVANIIFTLLYYGLIKRVTCHPEILHMIVAE